VSTSTLYASWATVTGTLSISQYVTSALGSYADGHNVDAIITDFTAAINAGLPEWLNLYGDEFLGETGHQDAFGLEIVREAIESAGFDGIAQKHAI
jgi:hypothetical protein